MGEFHGKDAATGRHRTKVRSIGQKFRQGNVSVNHLVFALGVHTQHTASPAVEISHNISHEFIGCDDGHLHDGFEQYRAGIDGGLFECKRTGNLEGHFR